jgi:hypothetical protein
MKEWTNEVQTTIRMNYVRQSSSLQSYLCVLNCNVTQWRGQSILLLIKPYVLSVDHLVY